MPTLVKPDVLSEEEMIARICAGEKTLFHELIRPYTRVMFGYAEAILHNAADSEEAVQEAALKVYLNLSKLEDPMRFRAWLLQIVINETRMYRRKLRRQLYEPLEDLDQADESDSVPRQFADWHELPDEALDSIQLRNAVRQAITKIPEHYREVLVLIDSQRIDYATAAVVLGVSVGVIKTRVHRARMKVQELLGPVFQPRFSDRIRLMKGMNPWFRAKS